MLENIKSIFVLTEILSFTDDLINLKLFKYNKAFQNKINIDLINYKFFSGRYIINKDNYKAKEYNCYNHRLYMKENIQTRKEMDREKNIIMMDI